MNYKKSSTKYINNIASQNVVCICLVVFFVVVVDVHYRFILIVLTQKRNGFHSNRKYGI